MSIFDVLSLKRFLWREQGRVIRLYYLNHPRFALADLGLGVLSLFVNPYRACRKFYASFGAPSFYGETPLTELEKIIRYAQLSSSDTYMELGSGRGKGCFWVAESVGCRTIGIERVPYFVYASRMLSHLFKRRRPLFLKQDMYLADLTKANFVYLDTTLMSSDELEMMAQHMQSISLSARVLTVSNPLPAPDWMIEELPFRVQFPWGEASAFLHKRK